MCKTTHMLANCLVRLKSGDTKARDDLISHASRRMLLLTQRMFQDFPRLQRWEEADDVFQQAMLRLDRALRSVRPESVKEFLGLAALQIRRELLDLTKHHFGPQGRAANHASWHEGLENGGENRFDPQGSNSCSPEQLTFWAEFHIAVGTLPESEKEAFELLWYHELTQQEAAQIMGISERQLRRYWQSSRLLLHKAVGDLLPEKPV